MYETGAPPDPAALDWPAQLAGSSLVVDPADDCPARVPPTAATGFGSPSAVLPAGPPPGTVTYRLRGTETAQDG